MRFFRYIAVQMAAYGLDMGSFLVALHLLQAEPIVANILGKVVAGIFAFFAHRSFTFSVSTEGRNGNQVTRYFILLALNIPLSSVALSLVFNVVSAPVLAKFISDAICVAVTYWLSKRYVFPEPSKNTVDATRQQNGTP